MNSFIETLNQWGGNFLSFAWPMLWQSSLLIIVLLAFDFLFRRKLRASIRYALWLVVLVKLCVPPTLALPTSPAWWLQKTPPPIAAKAEPRYTVTYDNAPLPEIPQASLPAFVPPKPVMTNAAWLLVFSASISSALLLWLLVRWGQITRQVRRAATSERLAALADEAQKFVGMKFKVQVKLTANSMSPAVCGLFRPAILIPQSLAENFSDEQLRAVLLHELIHLRRRDVWLNFFQALLQIFYWWHPLVWLANARIRQVREEDVDDAVMLALRDEAEAYAPTLLEVAKLALNRPLASLGLVGILESRHALRQRIERLVDFRAPRHAGLTLVSLLGILAFTAVAVPMGQGPDKVVEQANPQTAKKKVPWPDPNVEGYKNINLQAQFLVVDESELRTGVPSLANNREPTLISTDEADVLLTQLKQGGARFYNGYPDGILQPAISGAPQCYRIGGGTNQFGMTSVLTTNAGGSYSNIVAGFDIQMPATQPDWTPMNLTLRALAQKDGTHFQMSLSFPTTGNNSQQTEITVPHGKAIAWALNPPNALGKCQIVLLIPSENSDEYSSSPILTRINDNLNQTNSIVSTTTAVSSSTNSTEEKLNAGQLVQDGKLLYEMGKLDEAEVKLNAALALDSENVAAKYYLGLAQTNQPTSKIIKTSEGRQGIIKKLNDIRLDRVAFNDVPLGEVLRILNEELIKRDSSNRGINFLVNPNPDEVNMPPMIDLLTGLPEKNDASYALPVSNLVELPITLKQPLTDVRLVDVLDAVVLVAPKPIHYSVQDFAIVFSAGKPATPLFARAFKLNAKTFLAGIKQVKGVGEGIVETTNSAVAVTTAARKYFSSLGVNLESPKGKAVFFNDGLGRLFVRATEPDLDTIERAIQALNYTPPMIHIKARFLEVPNNTLQAFVAPNLFTNAAVQSGTNIWPERLTGLLTDKNFKAVLHALEHRDGVVALAEPDVTTISGRQTQMRATQSITVVTNFTFQENGTNGSIIPQTENVETGPVLDVVPYVLSDGYTINLALIPSLTEFLGYDKSTNTTTAYNRAGEKIDVPKILPRFSVRQMVTTLNLLDGQTAVIGGLLEKNYVGGKEVADKSKSSDKELLVFITATLVDPTGSRVHKNDDLPFAPTGIPPQPRKPK